MPSIMSTPEARGIAFCTAGSRRASVERPPTVKMAAAMAAATMKFVLISLFSFARIL
jgi:hypothetical protein